jgi:hypothetical protein
VTYHLVYFGIMEPETGFEPVHVYQLNTTSF